MRILICDDDTLIIEQLQKYIQSYFKLSHIKCPELVTYTNGKDLLADKKEKDLVFLDIEMPDMNGIYIGNALKKENNNVIIFVVTSYSEYLDDAMRFHVFRYLTKPLDRQRVLRNLGDALALYNTRTVQIPIETKQGVHILSTDDIISVEELGRKVILHTVQQDFESIHNMNFWIEQLPKNCFFQSHRSFIVNFKYVTSFDHSTIQLSSQTNPAYLTRRKYAYFKDAYFLYLENTR